MKKYWFVFSLYWQEALQQRSTFFMDRFRSLVMLVSFYYLWNALLSQRPTFAGYDRSQMLTYIFGMNILRSLIFASRTHEIAEEINHGRLSAYLLRPVNFMFYAFCRDLSEKTVNLVSAIIEIMALSLIFHVHLYWPEHAASWALFLLSAAGAIVINFFISFIVGCWGFWTAESGGPRFLVELFLEFTAGAFFPLDLLPKGLQHALNFFPSPYLVFFPLHLFLEKTSVPDIVAGFAAQAFWIAALLASAQLIWRRGLRVYGAEGS